MTRLPVAACAVVLLIVLSACSHDAQGGAALPLAGSPATVQGKPRLARADEVAPVDPHLTLPPGFAAEIVGNVPLARQLVVAANGDLLVGTKGNTVAIVPNADGETAPGAPQTLATLPEGPAASLVFGPNGTLYVGTEHAVWKMNYAPGQLRVSGAQQIAALRTGPIAPGSDGDLHHTTSLAIVGQTLFAGIGSSCNACTEADIGRAIIGSSGLNGENPQVYARNVRNAMALAVNPRTTFLWAGGAGQDALPYGHPYEYFDAITQHPAGSDWGWPNCEENQVAYTAGADCSATIVPHVELPAYATIEGATFYPDWLHGAHVFPARYIDGLFLSLHGSWHKTPAGAAAVGPGVVFVPMSPNGWDPQIPVNWNDPTAQYTVFFGGFQVPGTAIFRGRTTGVTYGPSGSLFVGDDQTGNIYRIRPSAANPS